MRLLLCLIVAVLYSWPISAAESGSTVSQSEDEAAWQLQLQDAQRRLEETLAEIARLSNALGQDAARSVRMALDQRAALGIHITTGPESQSDGVKVLGLSPGGGAESAGVKQGDLIIAIDGKQLAADAQGSPQRKLLDYLETVEPGSKVVLTVRRDDKELRLDVETGTIPSLPQRIVGHVGGFLANPHRRGMPYWIASAMSDLELVELTEQLGAYFGADDGVLVVRAPEGNAYGLNDGDVILSIDGRKPSSPNHALRILHSYEAGERIKLEILRHKRKKTLSAQIPAITGAPPLPPPPRSLAPAIRHDT